MHISVIKYDIKQKAIFMAKSKPSWPTGITIEQQSTHAIMVSDNILG